MAAEGDVIAIDFGIWSESLEVSREVTIVVRGTDTVLAPRGVGITVDTDAAVTIKNLLIPNASKAGVSAQKSTLRLEAVSVEGTTVDSAVDGQGGNGVEVFGGAGTWSDVTKYRWGDARRRPNGRCGPRGARHSGPGASSNYNGGRSSRFELAGLTRITTPDASLM
ncbi:MAG: hypothetical protein ACI9WU_000350 [Myxococcota bacterium]|jgi:hypothetical protein